MELLLLLLLGLPFVLLLKPLRDWYVVERRCSAGDPAAPAEQTVFTEPEAAEQHFQRLLEEMPSRCRDQRIDLWHVEARRRKDALSHRAGRVHSAVLLKSSALPADPPPAPPAGFTASAE